jgi:hypothetical protein
MRNCLTTIDVSTFERDPNIQIIDVQSTSSRSSFELISSDGLTEIMIRLHSRLYLEHRRLHLNHAKRRKWGNIEIVSRLQRHAQSHTIYLSSHVLLEKTCCSLKNFSLDYEWPSYLFSRMPFWSNQMISSFDWISFRRRDSMRSIQKICREKKWLIRNESVCTSSTSRWLFSIRYETNVHFRYLISLVQSSSST